MKKTAAGNYNGHFFKPTSTHKFRNLWREPVM